MKRLHRGQWAKMTPDFAAVSPINAVDKIKTPLLLIHGRKDVTVDHKQSVIMNSAMTKAGKTVEFVSLPLADHYFTREADRTTLLTSIETFLAKHNPPDCPISGEAVGGCLSVQQAMAAGSGR
jgi:dipeptidyl aminopeptidase/acylaminoacyl peptidase